MRLQRWEQGEISRLYVNDLVADANMFFKPGSGDALEFKASGNYAILAKTESELKSLVLRKLGLDDSARWSDVSAIERNQPSKYPQKKGAKKPAAELTIKDANGNSVEFTKRGNTITLKGVIQ